MTMTIDSSCLPQMWLIKEHLRHLNSLIICAKQKSRWEHELSSEKRGRRKIVYCRKEKAGAENIAVSKAGAENMEMVSGWEIWKWQRGNVKERNTNARNNWRKTFA